MGSSKKKHKNKKKHKSSHYSFSPVGGDQDTVSFSASEAGSVKISFCVPSLEEEEEEEGLLVQYSLEDIARARMESSHKKSKKSKKKHHSHSHHSSVDILRVTGLDDISEDEEIMKSSPSLPPYRSIGGKKFPPDYDIHKEDTPPPTSLLVSIDLDDVSLGKYHSVKEHNSKTHETIDYIPMKAVPPLKTKSNFPVKTQANVPIKSQTTVPIENSTLITTPASVPIKTQDSIDLLGSLSSPSIGDKKKTKKKKRKKHKHRHQVESTPIFTKTVKKSDTGPISSVVTSMPSLVNATIDEPMETSETDQFRSVTPIDETSKESCTNISPASSTTSSLRYFGSTKLPPNALKYFLRHLHNQICRNDPEGVFSEPVTDEIAPGYSSVIKQPMDLQTMGNKVEMNEYPSVNEFKEDFVVMCSNAMTYNSPETMYYQTAKKLLNVGLKMIQKEISIRPDIQHGLIPATIPLSSSIDYSSSYLCRINLTMLQQQSVDDSQGIIDVGSEVMEPEVDQSHLTQLQIGFDNNFSTDPQDCACTEPSIPMKEEDRVEEDILLQVDEATRALRERHLSSSPAELSYLNQLDDSKAVLHILNPHSVVSSHPVDLTALSEKVKAGQSASAVLTSELPVFKATPVSYLMYGPFGSFAPAYDTAFATLTKSDSSLLLSTYGSELGISYANSLQQFVKGCGSFASEMGNAILNSLTSGRHGKLLDTVKQKEEAEKQPIMTDTHLEGNGDLNPTKNMKDRSEMLEKQLSPGIPEVQSGDIVQDTINKTSTMLANLDSLQQERLGGQPTPNEAGNYTLPSPTQLEKETASKITSHLVSVASKVQPVDLVSVNSLHKAMGFSQTNATTSSLLPSTTSSGMIDNAPSSL